MKKEEYLMFDPEPIVLRRFNIPGGLGKRYLPLSQLLKNQLLFYHRVVANITHFVFIYFIQYLIFIHLDI